MAKSAGQNSPLTGKVGDRVYYYLNGSQVARTYVAKPNNPKSLAQRTQRLKMALTGRLSKVVPDSALEGFGGNRVARRSKFNSNVLLNTSVVDNVASVEFEDVVFSEGTLGLLTGHSFTAGTGSTFQRSVVVDVLHGSSDPALPEGYGERYVVLLLNNSTSQFDYAESGVLPMPNGAESTSTTVNFRVADRTSVYTALLYLIPFGIDERRLDGGARYSYIGTGEGTIVIDAVSGEAVGRPDLFGTSLFFAAVQVNPPA